MLTAEEARNISVRRNRIQTMLRDLDRIVEGCIRNCAENGKMEATLDLSALAPESADTEVKDRVVDAMLSELRMMGYHVDSIENSKMYRIDWREGGKRNDHKE